MKLHALQARLAALDEITDGTNPTVCVGIAADARDIKHVGAALHSTDDAPFAALIVVIEPGESATNGGN